MVIIYPEPYLFSQDRLRLFIFTKGRHRNWDHRTIFGGPASFLEHTLSNLHYALPHAIGRHDEDRHLIKEVQRVFLRRYGSCKLPTLEDVVTSSIRGL